MPKKTLEKRAVEEPVADSMQERKQRFYCCRCGKAYSRQKGFFPVSHSPMYRGSGYVPVCNDCIEELYDYYRRKLPSDREALKRICMKLDLYWSDNIYNMVEKTAGTNSRIRTYISKTNIIRYIDKTFDDTVDEDAAWFLAQGMTEEGLRESQKRKEMKEENDKIVVPDELIDFWGKGLEPDFYAELDRRYKNWTDDFDNLEPGEIALYKQICILEENINRDVASGKQIDKSVNALNSLLGSLNVKPSQKKSDMDSSYEKDPFGVWIRRWENEEPVPEPDPEFEDCDGIVRYIDTWLRGHLCKLAGKNNMRSALYDKEIEKMRVAHPEFEDEDDEELFNEVYGLHDDENDMG